VKRLVLDASAAIACCLGEAEAEAFADTVLEALADGTAVVPGIWASEVANVLVMKERAKRLAHAETSALLTYLSRLPVIVDWTEGAFTFSVVSNVAREHRLTVYDAHYLELAMRLKVPLASLDQELIHAARNVSVEMLGGASS
jgi:predicted nucleic acid-binding protein